MMEVKMNSTGALSNPPVPRCRICGRVVETETPFGTTDEAQDWATERCNCKGAKKLRAAMNRRYDAKAACARVSESQEQQALFAWAVWIAGIHPQLGALYHIPNEGKRTQATGARMKAEGLRPGIPDICLPVPVEPYSALYIEMKSRTGHVTASQRQWLELLASHGNKAVVCRSAAEAAGEIARYLHLNIPFYSMPK